MNILVTGSNGFIGTELCKNLLNKKHRVIGIDVSSNDVKFEKYIKNNEIFSFKHIMADITNFDDIDSKISWDDIDYVYHLAAMANINTARKYPRKCYDVNVTGTFNISRMCEENKIPICYISTQCVYGNQKLFPVKEDINIPFPTEIYGVTKYMGEQLIRMLSNWTILRYGTVVGENMRKALATWIFLDKAVKMEPMPIEGTGNQTRDWIYIQDLIDATSKVIDCPIEANREVINISGSESYSVLEMARMCWKITNGKVRNVPKMTLDWKPERFGQIVREETSNEKAKRILNWEPETSLYDALEKCYVSTNE